MEEANAPKVETKAPRLADSFTAAKTQAEADGFLKSMGLESEYERKNIHVDIANTVNQEITKYKDKFGDKISLRGIKLWPKRDANFAAAYSPAFGDVYLHRVKAKDALKMWAKDAANEFGLGTWSTGSKEHIIRHELGHAVHKGVGKQANKAALESLLKKGILESGIRSTTFTRVAYEKMGLTMQDLLDDVKKAGGKLSAYGFTSVDEMVAESIAEYMGGSPREFAESVVKTLMGW